MMIPYLFIKTTHVVAIIIFVGGLLSHNSALRNSAAPEAFNQAYFSRPITTVAMFTVWGTGILMASYAGWFSHSWLQLKFLFIVILSLVHGVQTGFIRRNKLVSRRIKTLLLSLTIGSIVAIAYLAVQKPQL